MLPNNVFERKKYFEFNFLKQKSKLFDHKAYLVM